MIDPILERAKLALDHLSNDPVAREEAFKREMELGDIEYHRQREIAEARAEGREEGQAEGREEGQAEGLRQAVEHLCLALDVELSLQRREALARASVPELDGLLGEIAVHRAWPSTSA